MFKNITYYSFLLSFLLFISCTNQSKPTEADYRRAKNFLADSIHAKVYHLRVEPHWLADSSGFAYHTNTRDGEEYYLVLYSDLKRRDAFDEKRLAEEISKITGNKVSAKNLLLRNIKWVNKDKITFSTKEGRFEVNLNNYHIEQKSRNNDNWFSVDGVFSPDSNQVLFIKDYNLYVKTRGRKQSVRLSNNGSKYYIYGSYYGWGQLMKGEDTGPEPRITADWSPNGKKILTQIMDARKGKKMYLLNWAVDSLYRPVLLSYYRASPGDTNDVKYKPVIFDVNTGQMTKIDIPEYPHYLPLNLHWTEDGTRLYGYYFHRGYKKMDVIEVDPQTGEVRVIYTDSMKTSVDYNIDFRYLEDKGIAFITSEKSGWDQIYGLNWETGEVHPVTDGKYVVKDILSIDAEKQVIFFTASGKKEGVNPYFISLYKINFDGSGLKLLTSEPLNHKVYLSPNGKYFVDNRSTATQPTVSLLRSTKDGRMLMEIDSADVKDLVEMGWQFPQIFTATARDGETTIYGALWKPTNFDPDHEYPLVDFTYTGPHTYVFPNSFYKVMYPYPQMQQPLAELGFIVMQVDGLGSDGRSKAFQNWSYGNMGKNLKGHVLAIRQLGKKYSWIDTTRVGIFGHSAGGYDAAHALMAFNDTYKAAISQSGDHDWRMEKAWWPEMYAGWPVDSVYQKQSNITMAPKLEGRLLLIHGGIDQNVNPSSTFRLAEALIKAGEYFDMLIIPSGHHHYPEDYQWYVTKKRWHFFIQNLIIDPPK